MNRNILQSTPDVCKKDYLIEKEQTDPAGNVTCSTLARFMQDITTAHMEQAGITVESLMEQDLLWVIVFTEGHINRLPRAGETIEQYSWAGAEKFGMHSSRYAFYTKEGEELLTVSSLFLLVNKETREHSEPTKETISLPIVQVEGEPKLPKMTQKFPGMIFENTHVVTENEIDYNGHVNNAIYLDWADSVFSAEYMKNHPLKSFWVQYEKEALLGQNVKIRFAADETSAFLKGSVEEADCFKARFVFAQ